MYCPNCGTELPDDAGFCRNCGAKVQRNSAEMQTTGSKVTALATEKIKKRLAPGWIVLIALVCVIAILCAVMIPIYAKAPVLPVSSSTSDGKSKFTYSFDKEAGELNVGGILKGFRDDDNSNYNRSPYVTTQWLIALSDVSTPYKTQSMQLCTMDEYSQPYTIAEYVLGNNDLIADGTIQKVVFTLDNQDEEQMHQDTTYEFETSDGRATQVKVRMKYWGSDETTTTYYYSYNKKGQITRIRDTENQTEEIYQYDETGNLKGYTGNGPSYSVEKEDNHISKITAQIGLTTAAETSYEFKDNLLETVNTEESSSWAGGGFHNSNSSQFSFQKERVVGINTSVNARGEDAGGGTGNYSYSPTISIVFDYQKVL